MQRIGTSSGVSPGGPAPSGPGRGPPARGPPPRAAPARGPPLGGPLARGPPGGPRGGPFPPSPAGAGAPPTHTLARGPSGLPSGHASNGVMPPPAPMPVQSTPVGQASTFPAGGMYAAPAPSSRRPSNASQASRAMMTPYAPAPVPAASVTAPAAAAAAQPLSQAATRVASAAPSRTPSFSGSGAPVVNTVTYTAPGPAQPNAQGVRRPSTSFTPDGCVARTVLVAAASANSTSLKVQLNMGFEAGMYILCNGMSLMARVAAVTPQDLILEAPILSAISSGDHVYGFTSISYAAKNMTTASPGKVTRADPSVTSAHVQSQSQVQLPVQGGAFSDVIAGSQQRGGGGGGGDRGGGEESTAGSHKSRDSRPLPTAAHARVHNPPALFVSDKAIELEQEMRNPLAGAGGEGAGDNDDASSSSSSTDSSSGASQPDGSPSAPNKASARSGKDGAGSVEAKTLFSGAPSAAASVVLPGPPVNAPLPSAANGKRRASLSLGKMTTEATDDEAGMAGMGMKQHSPGVLGEAVLGQGQNTPIASAVLQSAKATNKAIFEKAISERNKREQEGRDREQKCYDGMNDPAILQQARLAEHANPLVLAEILRTLVFFQGQQLVEENNVQPGGPSSNPYSNYDSQTNKNIRASMFQMAQGHDQLRKGMPLLKGSFAETVVVGVYQHYTNDSGFMSLETFVRFMSDAGFVNTHCPHTEFDEPTLDMAEKLDPIRLLTTLPKSSTVGIHDPNENIASAALQEALKQDQFTVNFTQWYSILLKIAQIVYPSVYANSNSQALNKILLESILPLYVWCSHGHSKLGTTDPLVADERIALLMMTYAPNLWKLFLSYSCDSKSRTPDLALSYPNHAQAAEAALFGVPAACPYVAPDKLHIAHLANTITTRQSTSNNTAAERAKLLGNKAKERRMSRVTLSSSIKQGTTQYKNSDLSVSSSGSSTFGFGGSTISGTNMNAAQTKLQAAEEAAAAYGLVISERRLLQLCQDFGITNDLVPKPILVALFKGLNKSKKITLGRTATKVDAHIAAKDNKAMLTTSQKLKSRRQSVADTVDAMYKKQHESNTVNPLQGTHGRGDPGVTLVGASSPKKPVLSSDSRSPKVNTGLAFSEFLEFLGHVALYGMELEHFHTLFPNPFSKVLALLTVWGLADTRKLQEVLHLHVDIVL